MELFVIIGYILFTLSSSCQTLPPEQQRVHRRPAVPQRSRQGKSSPDTRLRLGEQTRGASMCGEIITTALLHTESQIFYYLIHFGIN